MGFADVQTVVSEAQGIVGTLRIEISKINRDINRTRDLITIFEDLGNAMLRLAENVLTILQNAGRVMSLVPRRNLLTGAIASIGNAFKRFAGRLARLIERFRGRRQTRRNELADKISSAVRRVQRVFGDIGRFLDRVNTLLGAIWRIAEALKPEEGWINQVAPTFFPQLETNYLAPTRRVLRDVRSKIDEFVQVRSRITQALDTLDQIRLTLQNIEATAGKAASSIRDAFGDVNKVIDDMKKAIQPYIDEAEATIRDIPIIGMFYDGVTDAMDTVSGWMDDITKGLDGLFGKELMQEVQRHLSQFESVINQGDQISDQIKQVAEEGAALVESAEDKAQTVAQWADLILRILRSLSFGKIDLERLLPEAVRNFLDMLRKRREEAGVPDPELPDWLRKLIKDLEDARAKLIGKEHGTPLGGLGGDAIHEVEKLGKRTGEVADELRKIKKKDLAEARPRIIERIVELETQTLAVQGKLATLISDAPPLSTAQWKQLTNAVAHADAVLEQEERLAKKAKNTKSRSARRPRSRRMARASR